MTREQRHHVIVAPLLTWAGLLALLALTATYAYWPGVPAKLEAGLLIAVAKAALVIWFFMQLGRSSPLVRLVAVAGLCWLVLLWLFSFADFLTR